MATLIRLELGQLAPKGERWLYVQPQVDGRFMVETSRGPGRGNSPDYAPDSTLDLKLAIAQAMKWADANGIPTVYYESEVAA